MGMKGLFQKWWQVVSNGINLLEFVHCKSRILTDSLEKLAFGREFQTEQMEKLPRED